MSQFLESPLITTCKTPKSKGWAKMQMQQEAGKTQVLRFYSNVITDSRYGFSTFVIG